MADRYFDKFPVVNYKSENVIDITRRASLLDKVSSNPYVFYPYEITANERPDQLSARYYDDQFKSWIIYVANKITDPYYEWYMHEREFIEFLDKKYGSHVTAQQKIAFYRNDWVGKDSINVSAYNALIPGAKKYWEPELGPNNRTIGYKRKQIDWKANTNKVVSYAVTNGKSFVLNEICNIWFDPYNMGKGQVVHNSNNYIKLQHVSGTYNDVDDVYITGSSHIYGTESKSNTVFTEATVEVNNIPVGEESYWKAVSYFDYESERNEYNKTIRVLDSTLRNVMVDNLTDLMKE